MTMIRAMVEKEKPTKIITVGDRVTQDLTSNQLFPDVLIIDNRVMRKEITPISATAENTMNVQNPPGTITDEAWQAIETAMRESKRTKITVDGEEDLLTLVAVLAAPENSLVFYGQPHEGIVAVKATVETKQRIQNMIEEMKKT
ncbi:MAG: GTP-dependent dephospho-CoA kinase family protein [Candidatus Bathyarchaeota archaeon]|nr:GTP-dependent dephospho-CoA kinase family protein [Candidatus Bathyarchaeota archaeon]